MSNEGDVRVNFIGTKRAEVSGNRKRKTSEPHIFDCDVSSGDMVADKIPKKELPPSSSDKPDNSIHQPSSSSVTIQELIAKVNMVKKKGLVSEYESIRVESPAGTFNISKLKANQSKNRYSDVLCFDHSRVILPCAGENHISGYINANFVDGYKQTNAFICTQGPLPNTCVDFWRMVWYNQSRVVVMTTRTIERSKVKCAQYWPSENKGSSKYEELVVCNNGSSENQNFIETQLILKNTQRMKTDFIIKFGGYCVGVNVTGDLTAGPERPLTLRTENTGECRPIVHLQFTSWPDHGVPQASPFLEFLFRVQSVQEAATVGSLWLGHPRGPPIIVHCSAGIGRTGTFITVDICLKQLGDVGTVDLKETVRRIRSQRAYSIQVADQYVFCHQAIIEHTQNQRGTQSKH